MVFFFLIWLTYFRWELVRRSENQLELIFYHKLSRYTFWHLSAKLVYETTPKNDFMDWGYLLLFMLLMHNYNNCLVHLMRADIFLFISIPLSWAGYLKKSATQEIWKVRGVIIWKYGKWAGEESQTMRLVFDMPRKSESLYQDPGDSSLSSPLRQVVLWSKWEASKIYHRSRYRISWCCVWLFNVDSQKHNIWKACLPNWMVLCL